MPVSKLTLSREFGLGVGMTLFVCATPQADPIYTLALFVGMFTIYETFPEFHWVPAWTLFKIVNKEEDIVQGGLRVATQFLAATLAAIIGYQLLAFDNAAVWPTFNHVTGDMEEWRALLWTALVFAAWVALCNHSGQKDKDSFRRNLGLTLTYCSANYLMQGIARNYILNSAVNFGRFIGAKIYADGDDALEGPDMKYLWIVLCGPLLGVVLAKVALIVDTAISGWDAPDAAGEETTAIYGSTGNANADPAARGADLELSVDKTAADAKADENA